MKKCNRCGKDYSKHGPSLYCTHCANIVKAILANRRCKPEKKNKIIKLKNGLEVLDNAFGKAMAYQDNIVNYN